MAEKGYRLETRRQTFYYHLQKGDATEKVPPQHTRLTLHDEVEVAEWAPVPNYF